MVLWLLDMYIFGEDRLKLINFVSFGIPMSDTGLLDHSWVIVFFFDSWCVQLCNMRRHDQS